MKFDILNDEAWSILYDIAKFSQENDLKELLSEFTYNQIVKTKKKQNEVQIIDSGNFFEILKELGLIQNLNPKTQECLEKFLCLDPQY